MNQKVRKVSIRWKLLAPVCVVILIICSVLGASNCVSIRSGLMQMATEQAQSVAEMTASVLDVDKIATISDSDENSEDYLEQKELMQELRGNSGIKYMYTLYAKEDNVYYGIDEDSSSDAKKIGDTFSLTYEDMKEVFEGKVFVEPEVDTSDGESLLTVYAPIVGEENNVVGVLGCDYDVSGILAQINSQIMQIMVFSIIAFIIAFFLVFIAIQNVMRSLKKVNTKIYDLVNNEGDLTQKLDIRSGDELELISKNVNAMLEYIRSIMLNIAEGSVKLNGSSKNVVSHLSATQMSIADVSATMEEMSAGMEETSASLVGINNSVSEIVEEIISVNERAKEGLTSSADIRNRALVVHQKATSEQKEAKELAEQLINDVNEKIEKSKAVDTINALTDEIISITNQTNLLSLNASVEAARAGEAGRGFAVVAEKIGQLAIDSSEAATQIQTVSRQVIEAVDELATESGKMIQFMDETAMAGYEKLIEITQNYQEDANYMNESMDEFATSATMLKKHVDAIRESVAEVNIALEESTQGVTNISEATVNVNLSVEDIGSEASSNLDIANGLEDEVNRFKLG